MPFCVSPTAVFICLRRLFSGGSCYGLSRLIGFVFLGLAGVDLAAAAKPPTKIGLRDYVEKNAGRQAYGAYINDRKVGWSVSEFKISQEDGREVAIQQTEMQIRFLADGQSNCLENCGIMVFSLEGKGEILRAEEKVIEDGSETVCRVTRQGREMEVRKQSPGGNTQRKIPLPMENLRRHLTLDQWLNSRPLQGARFHSFSTDWDAEDPNAEEIYIYRGCKRILWGGIKSDVFLVTVKESGLSTDMEIRSDGLVLKGKVGGLVELRAEKESLARQLDAEPIDMLKASCISVDRDLGDPLKVRSLTLRVQGLSQFEIPSTPRQKVLSQRQGIAVLQLVPDSRQARRNPLTSSESKAFTKSTPALNSDHEKIRDLAVTIVGEETVLQQRADQIRQWVFEHIKQTMGDNSSTALDVLHKRAGDCTEITLLFVALARAAGIPAREVGGVIYVNDEHPLFGWHAWAEIHDGHQWVSMDPTWNQTYVDATHLKLIEDPKDWSWVSLIGSLRIEIVNFETTGKAPTRAKASRKLGLKPSRDARHEQRHQ